MNMNKSLNKMKEKKLLKSNKELFWYKSNKYWTSFEPILDKITKPFG